MPEIITPAITSSIVGIQGPAGSVAPGTTLRDGAGVPSNSLGIDGDYYLDHTTGNYYKRASGAYSLVGSFLGPQGGTGPTGQSTQWHYGSGAPNDAVGNDGDLYLVTGSCDLYQRASGHYGLITNIKGLIGATGAPGSTLRNGNSAPSNATGIDGDYFLLMTNGVLYQRQAGSYVATGTLMGPTGPSATVPVSTIGSSGASQALTFAPTGDKAYYITVSQALALSVTPPSSPTGAKQQIVCYLINPSGYPVTPPAAGGSVVYPNGTPNISGTKARIVFETDGNSTTIWGGV